MRAKLLIWCTLALTVAYVGHAAGAGQVYSNGMYGFQITLPKGWMAKEVAHEQDHYGFAFLTINNQRRDLDLGDGWWAESGWNLHGQKTHLQPGEVFMFIGYSGGPFPTTMRGDTVGQDLGSLPATNSMHESKGGFANYELNFFKRGQRWKIEAEMNEPVTEENWEKVNSILQSFRFLDGPIGNASWAEAVAWNHLPQNERAAGSLDGWPLVGEYGGTSEQKAQINSRFVDVTRDGDGYSVKFTEGTHIVKSWEYTLSADGKVREMTYRHLYRWKLIWEGVGMGVLLLALLTGLLLMERTARLHG